MRGTVIFRGRIDKAVDFRDDLFRNIPSIVKSQDLLDDLSDDPGDRAVGERLVAEGKDRDDLSPIITRHFQYSFSIGDAPNSFNRTRFSDGTRFGVWYGSLDLITTVYETAYHFRKRVEDMLVPVREELVSERSFQGACRGIPPS